MLIKHRIDDMNERLVAVKQPVSAGEQISLEPTFALMLAQHFYYASVGCKKLIVLFRSCYPLPVSGLKNGIQSIGKCLVRSENPKVSLLAIKFNHISQELS